MNKNNDIEIQIRDTKARYQYVKYYKLKILIYDISNLKIKVGIEKSLKLHHR